MEFKGLLNSLGLKTNTNSAIRMNKKELMNWIGRISIGAFCGVSQYVVFIPELNLVILPYHHMNCIIYSDKKDDLISKIEILINKKYNKSLKYQ